MKPTKNNKGFTLVELMIVVAIIGILAAIAIPQFAAYRTRSFNATAKALNKTMVGSQSDLNAELGCYGETTNAVGNLSDAVAFLSGSRAIGVILMSANSTPGVAIGATANQTAGRLSGNNTTAGKAFAVPLGIGAGMIAMANTPADAGGAGTPTEATSYVLITRHMNGDTAYGSDSDVPNTLFSVSNPAWAGQDGILFASFAAVTGNNGFDNDGNLSTVSTIAGNGAPTGVWGMAN